MEPLFTAGYSKIDESRFIQNLKAHACEIVCDVRSSPYSRYRPEFSRRNFKAMLNKVGIKYAFFGDGLGARPKSRDCYVNGVAEYALIEKSDAFRNSLDRIISGCAKSKIALVCSEADPIECHRAILVCKNLVDCVNEIRHIHSDGRAETHSELEDRLIELYGSAPPPLLRTEDERIEGLSLAYKRQGEAICFSESKEWKTNETVYDRFHQN